MSCGNRGPSCLTVRVCQWFHCTHLYLRSIGGMPERGLALYHDRCAAFFKYLFLVCAHRCCKDLCSCLNQTVLEPSVLCAMHVVRAGRPLPPLFNWLPGELDDVPADIQRKLQPKST